MTDPFWKTIAVLGIVLLLVIVVLLALCVLVALNLTKRPLITPIESPEQPEDDGSATWKAWNYLDDIDAKFLATDEPDTAMVDDKKYIEYADHLRAYASDVSYLAAQIQGMARNGVDAELLDLAAQKREWYEQWSDLKLDWATHSGSVARYERDHNIVWAFLESAWRGATQLDIFGRSNEKTDAQNQLFVAKDKLDKQTVRLLGKFDRWIAEKNRLEETYTARWNWKWECPKVVSPLPERLRLCEGVKTGIRFFIFKPTEDQIQGPFDLSQIEALRNSGGIKADTKFCREGEKEWMPSPDE